MRRKIMERLKKWQNAKNRLPLLLYGARQVGKTYILREFGRSCFENMVYVNFEEDKALAGYLEVKLTPAYIIKVIEEQYDVKIFPQKTLIISDENLFAVWAINAAGLAWIPARFLTVRIFSVTVALPLFLFFGLNKSLLFHSNLSGRLQFLSNVKYSG